MDPRCQNCSSMFFLDCGLPMCSRYRGGSRRAPRTWDERPMWCQAEENPTADDPTCEELLEK